MLVSQFIIQEKRSKEHLTPPARHRGPINDKDDDVSFANFVLHDHFISMIYACIIFVNSPTLPLDILEDIQIYLN